MPESRHLRSYGRIKARALKPRQAALLEALLPHLAMPEAGEIELEALFTAPPPLGGAGVGGGGLAGFGAASPPPALSPKRPSSQPLPTRGEGYVLEIGFGGGEHLVAQAAAQPDWRFIGVEPFINGVGSCLRHIEEAGVQNVRLHQGDARDVVARLPDACLDRIYILFPDPWPKARHHKRRLIQADFIADMARVLKPGGDLRFATDWKNYAAWTLELFLESPRFAWTAERAADWRAAWEGHVATRYEEKKLGDCPPIWLRLSRV